MPSKTNKQKKITLFLGSLWISLILTFLKLFLNIKSELSSTINLILKKKIMFIEIIHCAMIHIGPGLTIKINMFN